MNAKYNYYVGARSNLQEGEGAVQSTLHLAPGCVVYICCVLKNIFFVCLIITIKVKKDIFLVHN